MKKKLAIIIYLFIIIITFCKDIEIKNFYKVNNDLYRAAQPGKIEFKELEKLGIKSVLNLRMLHSDSDEAKETALKLYHVRMRAGNIDDKGIIDALKVIKDAPKPILVHCLHGSDRTGAVIAMYRIIFENYTKEKAILELREKKYGYHETIYKNIIEYIQNCDIEKIKKSIFLKEVSK